MAQVTHHCKECCGRVMMSGWMDKKQLALNEQESIVLHHLRPWKTYQID
jgi:hypothetical protein